jgi:hypothetical protein
VAYRDIHHPFRSNVFGVLIMAEDFSGQVYASIVDEASVTGEQTAETFMTLSSEKFSKVTINSDTLFDNEFFRTLRRWMGTKFRTVPMDAH